MVAADFYLEDGVHLESFQAALAGRPYTVGSAEGMRTLKHGTARGTLYGGCLSILVSLIGTPWEPRRKTSCCLLRMWAPSPTRLTACFGSCAQAGKLDGVRGIVFGEMLDCTSPGAPENLLEDAILSALDGIDVPIAFGLRSGHVSRQNVTLTFGIEAELQRRQRSATRRCSNRRCNHDFLRASIFISPAFAARRWPRWRACFNLQGHRITGSDKAAYPPMSDLLHSLGIPVLEPYSESNLDPAPDLVVIGNALSRGNPEVERVLDERMPFTSMAALVREEFLKGRESLVVAGTHGKTTTTSMLSWIYQVASHDDAALEPSFLIGGVAENFGTSFQLRPTRTFIIEGDEYDTAFFDKGPKFLHYFPDALILTHVEFDHADIYADLEAVKIAFKRLVNLVPRRGLLVAFDGSPNVSECISKALSAASSATDSKPKSDWQIRNLRHADGADAMGSLAAWRALVGTRRCSSPANTMR